MWYVQVKLVKEDENLLREILAAIKAIQPQPPIDLQPILDKLATIETILEEIDANTKPEPPVVGIEITPGPPTTHALNQKGDTNMGVVQVRLSKAQGLKKMARGAKGDLIASFVLLDNEDDTYTVSGIDAASNPVDISAVASLTPAPTSDNTSVLTVDAPGAAPANMTFAVHAVGPLGTANVLATATWNDGSLGPFSFTLPTTVQAGPAGGIEIIPGAPTVRQATPSPTGGSAPSGLKI